LVLGGVEVDEEIVDFVEDFLHARIGPVDFVDDDDGGRCASRALLRT